MDRQEKRTSSRSAPKKVGASTWKRESLRAVPKVVVSNRLHKARPYDPKKQYEFRYRAKKASWSPARCEILWRAIQRNAAFYPA